MYIISELTGKIYLDGVEIPLDDSTPQFQQYLNDKDTVGVTYVSATESELVEINKPKVPESISQMKLRKQLILSGISITSIDALIQSLPQPSRDLIYTMWEYAVVFDRANPELNAMAQMLEISSEQLDEIFIKGNQL